MSEFDEIRTSILGGEVARRNATGLHPAVFAAWGATLGLSIFVFITFGPSLWTLGTAGAMYVGVIGVTLEIKGDESIAGGWVHRLRWWWRRRHGWHAFINRDDADWGNPDVDPGWDAPPQLGNVEPLDLAGTGLDDLFILLHSNPGEPNYFSVVVAVQGLAEGLRGDGKWARTSANFSRMLSSMARRSSFIRSVQIVHRSVPKDLNPHINWIRGELAHLGPEKARQLEDPIYSYGDLIDTMRPLSEDHHCFFVLCFPQSAPLMKEAARIARSKGATIEGGVAQVIRDDTERAQQALMSAGMGDVEVLGEQRACAVIRAMLNPSHQIERHSGARWDNCIPTLFGGDEAVTVRASTDPERRDEVWHHRVATVPPGHLEPVPLGPHWLRELLTGVDPDPGDPLDGLLPNPTIRTTTVRIDLVRDEHARTAVKHHVTQDIAAQMREAEKGKVTDGGSEVMATASARRREDLKPGSGYHGVIWSMTIAVTGRDADDLDRACNRVTEAAESTPIKDLIWKDQLHDIAIFWTLPLGRGLATTKHSKKI